MINGRDLLETLLGDGIKEAANEINSYVAQVQANPDLLGDLSYVQKIESRAEFLDKVCHMVLVCSLSNEPLYELAVELDRSRHDLMRAIKMARYLKTGESKV